MPGLEPLREYCPWQARAIGETTAEANARIRAATAKRAAQEAADLAEYDAWVKANPPAKKAKSRFKLTGKTRK